MNSINKIVFDLANELEALIEIEHYKEFGNLMRSSKNIFQYAFENDILVMAKNIVDEHYEETFKIIGNDKVFYLHLIGIDYQEK